MHSSIIRFFTLCVLTGLLFTACQPKKPQATAGAKQYELKGKVVSADKAKHKVTIAHDKIGDYMEAMTMPFTLTDDWVYSDLTLGAQIQATLVVDQGMTWLENPVITKVVDPTLARSEETGVEPSAGAEVPDFTLVNQDGKKISFKQYRGGPLVLTFIYTRCPLPDYCPLMSQNFAKVKAAVDANDKLKTKTHLLSISVDPDYDKPQVLRTYGAGYVGKPDFKQWEFAAGAPGEVKKVAEFFGLQYWAEKDQIIHGLRTAIVSADGKVVKVYRGNEWKPEEIVRELEKL
ncbi:MAG: SCO family protein [Acidobacteria bacterium]|nr:SCO family protein [Acidobacteriota bacterium]MBI3428327.1 SCO family protein [Acidobacteriota bacterium]